MKAIFLDIDGVLNSSGSKKLLFNSIDEELLNVFQGLVERTKAEVIIISSRRRYFDDREILQKCFASVNVEISFLDDDIICKKRSDEILTYLKRKSFSKIVIVDDLDLGYSDSTLSKYFVQVNGTIGLSDLDCTKITKILA